jgi:signal peptidase II
MNGQVKDSTSSANHQTDTNQPSSGTAQTSKKPSSGSPSPGRLIFCLLVTAALIVIDQITKVIAVDALASGKSIPLIKGVLEFSYVENHGAAFGILQNALPFFVVITLAALAVIFYILVRVPEDRHFLPIRLCLCFIAAGAVGNFIDRLLLSYVRDFIYFCLIDFPVFNVADIYITCGTAILILLMLLYYRDEEELSFL